METIQPKQVIVMRKDLGMRKGKMIAQGAHASMKVFFDRIVGTEKGRQHEDEFPDHYWNYEMAISAEMAQWISGLFTKICVYVESEDDLSAVYSAARAGGIPCALIEDAGLTEFKGVPTKTCCAIGPANPDAIDAITGKLPLL